MSGIADDNSNKVDPMEKMRIRLAAESYQSFENEEENGNNEGSKGKGEKKKSGEGGSQLMCGLLVIAIILIVGLSTLLVVQHVIYNSNQECTSPDCVTVASSMLEQMHVTVDPCEDYYEFACGYMDEDPNIPPDKPKWGAFSKVGKINEAISMRLLDTPGFEYRGENSTAVAKAKKYFSVCMDIAKREAEGKTPLFQLIKKMGSWPIAPSPEAGTWDESSFDLVSLVSKIHTTTGSGLFEFGISVDDKNSSLNRMVFDQGGLTFSDYTNYVGNDTAKYQKAFIDYVSGVAQLLGADNNTAQTQAREIWDFEAKIAAAQDKPEERQDQREMYHLMTVQQLNDIMGDSFDILQYLNNVFPDPVLNTEQVIVYAPNFYTKLAALINDTPKKTLANYMVWHVVDNMLAYMPQEFELLTLELKKVLSGVSSPLPQWEVCVGRTSSALGFAVGGLFVEKHFTEDDKKSAETIVELIQSTFTGNLPKVDWMDDATTKRAIEKAEAVGNKIGYPEYIANPTKLDEHYEKMEVIDSMFQNALNVADFALKKNFDKRGKSPDKTEWSMMPTDVNAYYTPTKNEMVFPAGILRPPFYSPKFPMSVNFGAIGMVMGHELTHGFDNMGRLFDKDGNMDSWWTNKSAQNFDDKTQCLKDQYSQYKVGDDHLNGVTTLGENIADNGGLKTSYYAYHSWLKVNGFHETERLPGLNMTDDQLFFLGFAQMWCTFYTPEYAKRSLVTDVHSYAKYRVIGTLSNSREFSEAYQCKPGSAMNPENKCGVW